MPDAHPDGGPGAGRHSLRAVAMLVLATLLWGLSFPLMKALPMVQRQLVPGAGDWFLVFLDTSARFLASAALMLPLVARPGWRPSAAEVRMGVGLGVFAGAGMLLQMAGLQYTLASTSGFLTQFYVVLIPLALALRRRRRPPALVWASCALVLAGMGVLCGVDWRTLRPGRGETLTLLASVAFTGQILWLDRTEFTRCDRLRATWLQFATIGLMFAPVAWALAPSPRAPWAAHASLPAAGIQAVLALACGVWAFLLMNTWQPRLHPTQAGLTYCVEPVFASLYALFLPAWLGRIGGVAYANERLTASLWIGGALITLANVMIQRVPQPE